MDPLAAFYILEGLTMDVVGAILIVSGILSFEIQWTPKLRDAAKKPIDLFKEIMDLAESEDLAGSAKEIKEKNTRFKIASQAYLNAFNSAREKQKSKFTKNRAISGLSFLIGGFLLQGIGVVIQLF